MRLHINSAESSMLSGVERNLGVSQNEIQKKETAKRAEIIRINFLNLPNPHPDINDFKGNSKYNNLEILRDEKKVEIDRKRKFTEAGRLLENIFSVMGKNWFGKEEVSFVFTTDYDDQESGGDVIMEMKNENGTVSRILIDLTTAEKMENTDDKFYETGSNLKYGEPSNVKYFSSKLDNFSGELKSIPRVVAGVSSKFLDKIIWKMAAEKDFIQKDHPIQLMLLDEILSQLNRQHTEAEHVKPNSFREKILANAISAISKIMIKKEGLRTEKYQEEASNDPVYRKLKF
jgi:hypothetical protein